jgi:light-independent protochlorophyllide reductase subunit B
LPYGEAGTTRFLRELCALCEIPADRIKAAARDAKLMWFARTVDAHALSSKRAAVFGMPSTAAGIARALREELDMRVEFVGTFVKEWGGWLREHAAGVTDSVLVTDDYREVAREIDAHRPDIMFGSQMERHSSSALGVPCAVVSPPAHILNFPLGYAPFIGYDGANHLGDVVNTTQVLGLEHHLIETFGPRGQGRFAEAAPDHTDTPVAAAPVEGEPQWHPAAERLMQRVPFFVRKKARNNIERYAREHAIAVIDEAVIVAAREHVGG